MPRTGQSVANIGNLYSAASEWENLKPYFSIKNDIFPVPRLACDMPVSLCNPKTPVTARY